MDKLLVFISHISEEREIAIELKNLISASFLEMINTFVSSDFASVDLGQRWLDDITTALENCAVEIILCSPLSVERQWINFEAGAGWIRKIPVIPLCHSGMEPDELPIPIKLLQTGKLTEEPVLKATFAKLAKLYGSVSPNVEFNEFINKVKSFELGYIKKIELNTIPTLPICITEQPDDWYYHFRVEKFVSTRDTLKEPKYIFNQSKSLYNTVATRLYRGQSIQLAGLTIGCLEIDLGQTSIMVLRSKKEVDTSKFKSIYRNIKEQSWNELTYGKGIKDITASLVITNPYDHT
jgi:hypothetical protein